MSKNNPKAPNTRYQFLPHQGRRERLRRIRQIANGQLWVDDRQYFQAVQIQAELERRAAEQDAA